MITNKLSFVPRHEDDIHYRPWHHSHLTVTGTSEDLQPRWILIHTVLCFTSSKKGEDGCVMWERKRGRGGQAETKETSTNHNSVQKLSSRFNLTLLCDESTVRHMQQSRNVTHTTQGRRVKQALKTVCTQTFCTRWKRVYPTESCYEVMKLCGNEIRPLMKVVSIEQ